MKDDETASEINLTGKLRQGFCSAQKSRATNLHENTENRKGSLAKLEGSAQCGGKIAIDSCRAETAFVGMTFSFCGVLGRSMGSMRFDLSPHPV